MVAPQKSPERRELPLQLGWWKPEKEGEEVKGLIVDIVEPELDKKGKQKSSGWLQLDDTKGIITRVNRYFLVNKALEDGDIKMGTYIAVQFVGKQKRKGSRSLVIIKVFVYDGLSKKLKAKDAPSSKTD